MSDYDYTARRRIEDVKSGLDRTNSSVNNHTRELGKLKEEFEKIRRDQANIIENQRRMTLALERLAGAVEAMHSEMFPKTRNTKPALKTPTVKRDFK